MDVTVESRRTVRMLEAKIKELEEECKLLRETLGDTARREGKANAQIAAWKDHARLHGCVRAETETVQ